MGDTLNAPVVEHQDIFPEMKEINDIWNETMTCANPMEIEGRDILEAPIYFADETIPVPEVEAPIISIPGERPRKRLRLIMPKPEPEPMVTSEVPTTPEVLETFERSLQKSSEESIDLLAYVTDSTIKVDDPAFLAFIGNTTPG